MLVVALIYGEMVRLSVACLSMVWPEGMVVFVKCGERVYREWLWFGVDGSR